VERVKREFRHFRIKGSVSDGLVSIISGILLVDADK